MDIVCQFGSLTKPGSSPRLILFLCSGALGAECWESTLAKNVVVYYRQLRKALNDSRYDKMANILSDICMQREKIFVDLWFYHFLSQREALWMWMKRGAGIICSRSLLRLFCKTKQSSQTLIEKYSAVRRKFINWHQLMCALFISGEHEKWSKEVWNCRRAGWAHCGWARWFVSSSCRGVWAKRWRAGGTEGQGEECEPLSGQ